MATCASSEATMELGHLPSCSSNDIDGQSSGWKLDLSLLHLPNELLLLIFGYLGEEDLYTLSLLSRRLHHLTLPLFLVHCGLSKSGLSLENLVLVVDQATASRQKRGLFCLQISIDIITIKRITYAFHYPRNTLSEEVRILQRLMEKVTSVEEVILVILSQPWESQDKAPGYQGYPFSALLNTVTSKSSHLIVRQGGLLTAKVQLSSPFPTTQPASGCFTPRRRKTSIISRPFTTIQKLIGTVTQRPSLPKSVQGDSTESFRPSRLSNTPTLNALTVASSMLFHASFSLWTIETINNSPINTLAFDLISLTSDEWRGILPILTLPALSVLSISSCDIALTDLSLFLSRHRNITTFSIGANSVDLDRFIQPNPPELLPHLTALSAPTNYTVHFLKYPQAFPKLRSITIVSHVTFVSDFITLEQAVAAIPAHQFANISLSLELHVHTSNWVDMDACPGTDDADTLSKHVTSLVIKAGWYGLQNHVRHRLPSWLVHFRTLEKLTFVDQSRWPSDAEAKQALVRSTSAACPSIKTIVINDEGRDIRTWLTM